MIRFVTGLIIAMGAVDAPIDAPLTLIIAQAIVGLIIAGFGARKLTKGN
jgi:hypothetical protein